MKEELTKWQQARLHGLCAGKHLALSLQEAWRAITSVFGRKYRWAVVAVLAVIALILTSGCQTQTYQLPPPDSLPRGEYQVQPDGSLLLMKRHSISI